MGIAPCQRHVQFRPGHRLAVRPKYASAVGEQILPRSSGLSASCLPIGLGSATFSETGGAWAVGSVWRALNA